MEHGIEGFFIERARSSRRVVRISVAVGLALLAAVNVPALPPIRRALQKVSEDVPFLRFGFKGPTKVVELIQLDTVAGSGGLRDVGRVRATRSERGAGTGTATPEPRAKPGPTKGLPTVEGDAEQNLVRRALSGESGVPLFQSEELILDRLVRPIYPEEVRLRGGEGRVRVLAFVDTLGNITETALIDKSGEPALDHAAVEAVRQCRFLPYRENGAAKEVYAVFRFAFRIY